MAHPLYSRVLPHVNKPMTVHHVDGTSYYGTLQRVTPAGLYLAPHATVSYGSEGKQTEDAFRTAELDKDRKADAKEVFFAPFFFPFAALAGFTLGFVAGARRAYYPYYPYYPPYPYPYYW